MSIVTLFLITPMVALFNFGRITAFAIEKVVDNIPAEIKSLLMVTKQTLVLNFKDLNSDEIINRAITAEEIQKLFE